MEGQHPAGHAPGQGDPHGRLTIRRYDRLPAVYPLRPPVSPGVSPRKNISRRQHLHTTSIRLPSNIFFRLTSARLNRTLGPMPTEFSIETIASAWRLARTAGSSGQHRRNLQPLVNLTRARWERALRCAVQEGLVVLVGPPGKAQRIVATQVALGTPPGTPPAPATSQVPPAGRALAKRLGSKGKRS